MDRLLLLRLESAGCAAEALFNGVPLARVGGACHVVTLPVHEFTLAGANEVELVVEPGPPGAPADPQPVLSDGRAWASLRLLLPRIGSVAHPESARTLAQLDWAPPADEVYETPVTLRGRVELPISFPRWRWLDVPVVEEPDAIRGELAAFLCRIAVGLRRGNPEPLIQATRLRIEDLAVAYQCNLADEVGRLRAHIQRLHAQLALAPELPSASKLRLRPVAGGRLLECLDEAGEPLLRCPVTGGAVARWPMRVAVVEGQFYVLR